MSSAPHVTVLMGVHNGEPFLSAAIESILAQSLRDFEFVIVDDGSTDRTREIIQAFNEPRIRLIVNQSNLGLTASLNMGLREARAALVARQDADDVSSPGRLEAQLRALGEIPTAVLATSGYELMDEEGGVFGIITPSADKRNTAERFARGDSPFPHGSVMFRREAVLSIGGYDERFWFAQDFDLWVRLLAANWPRVVVVPETLYRLRKVMPGDPLKLACQRRYAELAWAQHLSGVRIDFGDVRQAVRDSSELHGGRDRYTRGEHFLSLALTALGNGYQRQARRYAVRAMSDAPPSMRLRALWRILLSVFPTRSAKVVQRVLWHLVNPGSGRRSVAGDIP